MRAHGESNLAIHGSSIDERVLLQFYNLNPAMCRKLFILKKNSVLHDSVLRRTIKNLESLGDVLLVLSSMKRKSWRSPSSGSQERGQRLQIQAANE